MAIDFPSLPAIGQQFTGGSATYQWDGTAWNIVPQMGPMYIGDTPPSNPAIGQQWWRSSNGQQYLWYDDGNTKQWVQSAGAAAAPGLFETITDEIIPGTQNAWSKVNLGAYELLWLIAKLWPSTSTNLLLRTSTDNGANFSQGASDYGYQYMAGNGTTPASNSANSSAFPLSMIGNVATADGEGVEVNILIHNFNKNARSRFNGTVHAELNSGGLVSASVGGRVNASVARNAIQLYCGTGNINGNVRLLGVRG
jgi:hypothetical protein